MKVLVFGLCTPRMAAAPTVIVPSALDDSPISAELRFTSPARHPLLLGCSSARWLQ